MANWGDAMYVTPGVVVDGKLVTHDLVDINLGIRILLGIRTTTTGRTRRRSSRPTRSATRSISGTPGTRPPSRGRRSATSTASTPGSCRRAGSTGRTTWRSTPAAARSPGSGPRRWRASWTSATSRRPARASRSTCPRPPRMPEVEFEWKIPKWSNAIERDRARTYFQAYAAACALSLRGEGAGGAARRPDQDLDRVQGAGRGHRLRLPRGGARRALAPRRHPRRQDRQLPPLSADALERQPARHLRHARPLRGRGAEHADLRGERPRQLQGHRHHARGAQLRPVPAVRRPHVPGQRQGARDAPLAPVRQRC